MEIRDLKYCPNCGSNHIHKCGHTKKGTQRYFCQNCKQRHTEDAKFIFQNKDIICPHCGSIDIGLKGHTRNGNQRYYCKVCKRKFAIYEKPPALSLEHKKLITFYHNNFKVSINSLAKSLHHSPSTISQFLKNCKGIKI